MFIRLFQILAAIIVAVFITGGGFLAIWPESAPVIRDSLKTTFNFLFQRDNPSTGVSIPFKKRQQKPPPTSSAALKPKSIVVDSYLKTSQHPLKQWALMSGKAGYIDTVKHPGQPSTQAPTHKPSIIELSGWAGHTARGMRFAHIVFSMCNNVIGSTEVDVDRPDVAKNVHINLMRSGWRARLYVGHLPTCAPANLRAWGLASTGNILWPLNENAAVGKLVGTQREKLAPAFKIITSDKPLHPSRVIMPKLQAVTIKSRRVNLRRCASTSCKIVGKIKGGKHLGYIVEKQDQWALIQLNASAGWMASRLFSVSPATK